MHPNLVALLYLAAGVLFILALRGLSSPESSRRGNLFGMVGMTIAVLTTLAQLSDTSLLTWALILVGLGIGGGIGATIARRIPMTSMPELVAAFHSLVGLAAVFVAAGALYAPEAFGIGHFRDIAGARLLGKALWVALGGGTFSGSVIPLSQFAGPMAGKAIILPARELVHARLGVVLVLPDVWFWRLGGDPVLFWAITAAALL